MDEEIAVEQSTDNLLQQSVYRVMIIRKATKKDIQEWSEMRTALWPDSKAAHISEINEYFSGSSVDVVVTFIAEVESQVIGFLELNIRNFAEGSRHSKVPYVEAWYIKPTHQTKGYGKQLMQHAEKWAMSLGYTELASDTDTDNHRSISMHKYLGFEETGRIVCFLKKLSNE
jgi:aminoglycoside 6'-N-acetyltransferase I